MAKPPDKYSPEEMNEILGRALERSREPVGVDHATMVEAAREVGIPEAAIETAERELKAEKLRRSRQRRVLLGVAGVALFSFGGVVSLKLHERSVAAAELAAIAAANARPTTCPADMVGIPGGTYTLGERHETAAVHPYCLDRSEVTVAAFATCVTGGQCTEPDSYEPTAGKYRISCNWKRPEREQHPVNCVAWNQAVNYCRSLGRRLPTEDEWEWAARNGPAATLYPWGNLPPDAQHVNACGAECPPHKAATGYAAGVALYPGDDGFPETAPVGSFPLGDNQWGVHDLAGNVREWTATYLDAKAGSRLGRGGAWDENAGGSLLAADRSYSHLPAVRSFALGFRCAL